MSQFSITYWYTSNILGKVDGHCLRGCNKLHKSPRLFCSFYFEKHRVGLLKKKIFFISLETVSAVADEANRKIYCWGLDYFYWPVVRFEDGFIAWWNNKTVSVLVNWLTLPRALFARSKVRMLLTPDLVTSSSLCCAVFSVIVSVFAGEGRGKQLTFFI